MKYSWLEIIQGAPVLLGHCIATLKKQWIQNGSTLEPFSKTVPLWRGEPFFFLTSGHAHAVVNPIQWFMGIIMFTPYTLFCSIWGTMKRLQGWSHFGSTFFSIFLCILAHCQLGFLPDSPTYKLMMIILCLTSSRIWCPQIHKQRRRQQTNKYHNRQITSKNNFYTLFAFVGCKREIFSAKKKLSL